VYTDKFTFALQLVISASAFKTAPVWKESSYKSTRKQKSREWGHL